MLETPKAHQPKRSDEISTSVRVTKVEKIGEILARLNPKRVLHNGESAGKLRIGEPPTTISRESRLKRAEVVCPYGSRVKI